MLSHYHNGISYHDSFELTPFEKHIAAEFIQEEHKMEMKLKSMQWR